MKWLKRKDIVNTKHKKMRTIHDFKIDEKEFLGYLFNYKKSLIIDKSMKIEKNDYCRLFEVIGFDQDITGRLLLFEITDINRIEGMCGTKDIYYIDLEKVSTG
ncbi:hypothetical protein KAR91_14660 [Candidatus Pacearchaeota archaeon]|nr:hypothetical protein [Candidatus Pacearchaeota archaeon]